MKAEEDARRGRRGSIGAPPVPSASRRPVCFKLTHYRLFARLAGPPAAVYAHLAAPGELLLYAHVGPEGDGYDEYVIDPAFLNADNVVEVDRV